MKPTISVRARRWRRRLVDIRLIFPSRAARNSRQALRLTFWIWEARPKNFSRVQSRVWRTSIRAKTLVQSVENFPIYVKRCIGICLFNDAELPARDVRHFERKIFCRVQIRNRNLRQLRKIYQANISAALRN